MKDKTLVESVKAILKLPVRCMHGSKQIFKFSDKIEDIADIQFLGTTCQYNVSLNKRSVNIMIWWYGDPSVARRAPIIQIPLSEEESTEVRELFNNAAESFKQECMLAIKLPMLTTPSTTTDSLIEEDENCKQ